MSSSPPLPVPGPKGSFRGNAAPAVHRRRKWPYLAGLLLVGLIAWGLWPKPVGAEVERVSRGPLQVTVNDQGQTRVKHRYVISSPVSGRLRRIELKAGAAVEAGVTPVAYLETNAADLLDTRTLAQAEARLGSARAGREQAAALEERAKAAAALSRSEFERAQQLFGQGGISQQELDQAEMRNTVAREDARAASFALQVAVGEEQQAEAVLQRGKSPAAEQAAPLVITSPVTGRVLRVFQESQRPVTPGLPLLEVGDPTDLEIWIEVLSRDGVAIKPGAAVWLEQWGGTEPLRARVRLVEPSGWTKISALGVEEQRVWVIADFVDPVERRPTLGDAYRVEGRIVLWQGEQVLQVPSGAAFQQDGKWKVYAVEGGRARLREIQVGHANGLQTEVLEGLAEGAEVIVYPGDRIEDGSRVTRVGK